MSGVMDFDESMRYACEHSYEVAMSCISDALFVANEREYHGVVALLDHARSAVKTIGQLGGINGQKRIGGAA